MPTALNELTASAAENVPGAQYAGITVLSGDHGLQLPAPTHRYPAVLDEIQERHRQGPCWYAATHRDSVHVTDLRQEARWPHFRDDALASTPIRSMICFAVSIGAHFAAALNMHAERPHSFSADALDIGRAYALHTALTWDFLRRKEQFRKALASRDVIGQAKGLVMHRFGIDSEQAFALLRRLSQTSNMPVRDVAGHLVDSYNSNPHNWDV